jgi:hypothetical protein
MIVVDADSRLVGDLTSPSGCPFVLLPGRLFEGNDAQKSGEPEIAYESLISADREACCLEVGISLPIRRVYFGEPHDSPGSSEQLFDGGRAPREVGASRIPGVCAGLIAVWEEARQGSAAPCGAARDQVSMLRDGLGPAAEERSC